MFSGLLSNTRLKAQLEGAVRNNTPSHAYLLCGAEGSGKKTAARLLARAIVGKNPEKADRGTHPDIIAIRPEADKKTVTVDQIRDMRADAFVNPTEGTRKIYIIETAHLVNENGQNALLTVLEQPPSFVVFILLAESREQMLPTVVSRCTVFDMEYVDPKEGADFLSKRYPKLPYARLETAMHAAQGNVGLAIKLARTDTLEKNGKLCERVLVAMANGDGYTAATILTTLKKNTAQPLLSMLAMYLRDVAVYRVSKNADNLVFRDSILQNVKTFDKIDINVLYNGVVAAENAIAMIDANVNATVVTADLVIQLFGGRSID